MCYSSRSGGADHTALTRQHELNDTVPSRNISALEDPRIHRQVGVDGVSYVRPILIGVGVRKRRQAHKPIGERCGGVSLVSTVKKCTFGPVAVV